MPGKQPGAAQWAIIDGLHRKRLAAARGSDNNMANYQSEVIYRIDRDDLLVFFNDQWDLFARDNDGPQLHSQKIHKRSLWDFIHDAATRHLHGTLLKRVRANSRMLNLPFRCDSPAVRRFMEMDILPLHDGKIEYRCRIIKTELREALPIIAGNINDGESLLRMCSWCKKIDAGNSSWVEIEDAIKFFDLFAKTAVPQISHTICDVCMKNMGYDG